MKSAAARPDRYVVSVQMTVSKCRPPFYTRRRQPPPPAAPPAPASPATRAQRWRPSPKGRPPPPLKGRQSRQCHHQTHSIIIIIVVGNGFVVQWRLLYSHDTVKASSNNLFEIVETRVSVTSYYMTIQSNMMINTSLSIYFILLNHSPSSMKLMRKKKYSIYMYIYIYVYYVTQVHIFAKRKLKVLLMFLFV